MPEAFLEKVVQKSLKVPARVWRATFEGPLEDDTAGALDTIKAPALIIWGDQDSVLPRDGQEALIAALPEAQKAEYPGAGHALYWEKP